MPDLPPELYSELHSQIIKKTCPTENFENVAEEINRERTPKYWKSKIISNAALLTVSPFLFLLTKIRFIGVICFAAGFVGIIAFSILLIHSIMGLKKIKTEGKEL